MKKFLPILLAIIGVGIIFTVKASLRFSSSEETEYIAGTPQDVPEPVFKLLLPKHAPESSIVEKVYYDALLEMEGSSEWKIELWDEIVFDARGETVQTLDADASDIVALCVFSDTPIPDLEKISEVMPSVGVFTFREFSIPDVDSVDEFSPSEQKGYIGGLLTSSMTRTNSVGFIGGIESESSQSEFIAFEDAIHSVNADATVNLAYADSFSSSQKGAELARAMVKKESVDVIFSDASYVDIGVMKEIEQKRLPCKFVRVLNGKKQDEFPGTVYSMLNEILADIVRDADFFQGKSFNFAVGNNFVGWVFDDAYKSGLEATATNGDV